MRRTGLLLISGLTIIAMALMAAAQTAQKPTFEVASIKPNRSGSLATSGGLQACRYVANNETLKMMVYFAYRLPSGQNLPLDRIIGGPSWIEKDRFDVEAKRGSNADSIQAIAFSPDSKTLAYGGLEGNVWLWDLDGRGEPTLRTLVPRRATN